jgi:hypothetical protein
LRARVPLKAASSLSRWSHGAKLAVAAGAALAVGGAGVALGAGFDPTPEHVPWTKRCVVEIRAYDDASASLFCEGRRKPFGSVDAETGRIRFYIPD